MKSALIVGANSMLGRNLIDILTANGVDVLTAGRFSTADIYLDLHDGLSQPISKNIQADIVFHCASSFADDSWEGIRENYQVNAAGCLWVLELVESLGSEALIYAGSLSSNEKLDPGHFSSYGFSKSQGENILDWGMKKLNRRFCSLRFSQMYDTEGACIQHQPWFGRIIAYAARGLDISMPESDGVRNFLHVEDAARLMFTAGQHTETGILDVIHPDSLTYQQIATVAYTIFGAGGCVTDAPKKTPFRYINFPNSNLLLFNQSPMISIQDGIERIYQQQTWSAFGPLDVT